MPVELTQKEHDTLISAGYSENDIKNTINHYRSLGSADNEIYNNLQKRINQIDIDNLSAGQIAIDTVKQFGKRAGKSYLDFSAGLGDLTALAGDTLGVQGLSDYGRTVNNFWTEQSEKLPIDSKYSGLQGLSNPKTFIPTLAGEVGGQTTNLAMSVAGGVGGYGAGAKLATVAPKVMSKAPGIMSTLGAVTPNIVQEGTYLDKINTLENKQNGIISPQDLRHLQATAIGEKVINSALEGVADKMLVNRILPGGSTGKGFKKFAKAFGEQALTEGLTETAQEGVSIGAENLLGIADNSQNINRLLESGVIGSLTGGVLGGASSLAPKAENYINNKNQSIDNARKEVHAELVRGNNFNLPEVKTSFLGNVKNFINNIINSPTAFDSMRFINHQISKAPDVQTVKNILHESVDIYKNLYDISSSGYYNGQKLDESSLKSVRRHLQNMELNLINNPNISNEDFNFLKNNILDNKINYQKIQGEYNVYGVPVKDIRMSQAEKFALKYSPYYNSIKSQENIQKAQKYNKTMLSAFKNNLIKQGIIKQEENQNNNSENIENAVNDINTAQNNSNLNKRYNYNVSNRKLLHGLTQEQRTYIAEKLLSEYQGNLYENFNLKKENNLKNPHKGFYDTNNQIDFKKDKYLQSLSADETINISLPGTNFKMQVYKNPVAVRSVLKNLGVKIEPADKVKLTVNKDNPSYSFPGRTLISESYITDGKFIIRQDKLNIKNDDVVKKINDKNFDKTDDEIKSFFSDKKDLQPLTDKNAVYKIGNDKIRIFETPDGKTVFIHNEQAELFDNYRLYQKPGSELSNVQAIDTKGQNIGLIMPVYIKDDIDTSNIIPYKNQKTFENKVYKDNDLKQEESAVFEYNKEIGNRVANYKNSAKPAFTAERKKLETQTQKKRKETKKNLKEKIKALQNTSEFIPIIQEAVRDWYANIEINRLDVNKDIQLLINEVDKFSKSINVKNKYIREIMPFLVEETELPSELVKFRPELQETWDKLTKAQRDELTAVAKTLSKKFKRFYDEYRAVNGNNYLTNGDIENYVTHVWDLDNKTIPLLVNYINMRSNWAKQRVIETLYDGIQGIDLGNGKITKLKPKTLDFAELLQIQSDSMIKAVKNKMLADFIKKLKTKEKVPLVLPASDAPLNWVLIDHPALYTEKVIPGEKTAGEVVSPALQNILHDLGVAIGRRISDNADYRGVYKRGKRPPEISLKRWIPNKTIAHEIGHHLDYALGLGNDFLNRHKEELYKINKERIESYKTRKLRKYAQSAQEQIAEFFGYLFNDTEMVQKIAPNAFNEAVDRLKSSENFAKLLPENFDWNYAKNILEEQTNTMFKMAVKVHPDIANSLLTVFEPRGLNHPIIRFFDNANSVLKQFQLGFSLFHAWALSESALANIGIKKSGQILSPARIYEQIKTGNFDIYQQDSMAKDAIEVGLQVGATSDIFRSQVESILEENTDKLTQIPNVGKYFKFTKILPGAQKLNNKFLWDYLHNAYKLNTYYTILGDYQQKHGIASTKVKQEIAQWVNDSYGGQVWSNLEFKPSMRKILQRILLSPDWLISTVRQFLGMFSSSKGQRLLNEKAQSSQFWYNARSWARNLGINSITNDVTSAGVRGEIARKFWGRAFIQSAIYMTLLNAVCRGWDKKEHPEYYPEDVNILDFTTLSNVRDNKTYVFVGRNKDGSERYLRLGKQFREVPELVTQPREKIGGKLSPTIQLAVEYFTGSTAGGFKNPHLQDKDGIIYNLAFAGELAKAYLPFSFGGITDTDKEFHLSDLVAPSSKGLSYYKGVKLYKDAIKNNDEKEIKSITRDLIKNNQDTESVFIKALDEIEREQRSGLYKKARRGEEIIGTKQGLKINQKIIKYERKRTMQRRFSKPAENKILLKNRKFQRKSA